ncbi:MAG: uracil phosphoribosyltransferase [Myxococcales bacterium]|nr:uracil phosphoribosyltransferase [Myxococcales bacterium]MCB9645479.1 uracil phosphoribosyltransferase [Deltaproteobacteria bacterium]
MPDHVYEHVTFAVSEIEHRYGPNVHLLADPYLLTLLAQLCSPDTVQPVVNRLVHELYRFMTAKVMATEFPRRRVEMPTRMIASTPRGVYVGEVLEPRTRAVVVDVARAGMLPAMVVYDALNHALDPRGVRQDHVVMSRTTDERTGAVTGVSMSGSKVAGDAAGAVLMVPDPMGATGSSACAAVDIYHAPGMQPPSKVILMNLIVTPQYLRRVTTQFPSATIYAVRLDRGLSSADVLRAVPGERWDEENGLDDHQYIVPGGGGFGELMNNAYV